MSGITIRVALVGIITDGDLRRKMGNELLKACVDDVMTRAEDRASRPLLSETLDILNSMKVTAYSRSKPENLSASSCMTAARGAA